MDEQEILRRANEIVGHYDLKAELFPYIWSVGVQGDKRTYTQIMNLVGPHPGNYILAMLSTTICNELPINRVTFEIT